MMPYIMKNKDSNTMKNKQKSTNIEDITNDDVIRYLDHNVDDMNFQNQIQEEIELGM